MRKTPRREISSKPNDKTRQQRMLDFLDKLDAEHGPPSPAAVKWAESQWRRPDGKDR